MESDLRNPSVFGNDPWEDGWIPQHNNITCKWRHDHIYYYKLLHFGLGLYVLKSILSKRLNFKKKGTGWKQASVSKESF